MSEPVKDRIYFRCEPPFVSDSGQTIPEAFTVSIRSPETGYTNSIIFSMRQEDLGAIAGDLHEFNRLLAHQMAVGMVMGFKHGVLVGAIAKPIDVLADLDHEFQLIPRGAEAQKMLRERYDARLAEDEADGYGKPEIVDWTRNSFSYTKEKP